MVAARTHIVERDSTGAVRRQYIEGKLLGKGGFARCYQATDCATKEELAVKVIDKASLKKPKTKQKLISEIKIHSMMHHANVVQYKHCFEDDHYVYIVLELCTEQTLMEHSKRKRRFSEEETAYLMHQCVKGVKYMHENAVIHRDLKLSNLLLSDTMEVKIADFGLATQLDYDGERKRTVCGTPNYIAPEILAGSRHGHSFEVDIWSLGVIMYTLLVGKPPFEMADMESTYKRIRQVSYSFPADLHVSSEARNLVRRILQADPERRPNLVGIENDPFFHLHPPPALAPLSLFQPGTAHYYAHERKLAEAGLTEAGLSPADAPRSLYAGRSPVLRTDAAAAAAAGGYRTSSVPRTASTPHSSHHLAAAVANPGYLSSGARSSTDWSPGYRSASAAPSASPSRGVRGGLAPPVLPGTTGGGGGGGAGGGAPLPSHSPSHAYGRSGSVSGYHHQPASVSPSTHHRSSSHSSPSRYGRPFQARPVLPEHQAAYSPDSAAERGLPARAPSVASTVAGASRSPSVGGTSPYRAYAARHFTPSASPALSEAGGAGSAGLYGPPPLPTASPPKASAASASAMPPPPPPAAAAAATTAASAMAAAEGPVTAPPLACWEEAEERANLTTMHEALERTMGAQQAEAAATAAAFAAEQQQQQSLETSVTCYSDFTSKYGLAYLMNNGHVGVSYNDSTKMVWNVDTNTVQYVSRGRSGEPSAPAAEDKLYCTVDDYPDHLRKKITLITYFRNYLTRSRSPKDGSPDVVPCSKGKPAVTTADSDLVYVKRWLKTKYAIIFRLSNKSVQVLFMVLATHTHILLATPGVVLRWD